VDGRALVEVRVPKRVSVRDVFDFACFIIAGSPDFSVLVHGDWLSCCGLDRWMKILGVLGSHRFDMDA